MGAGASSTKIHTKVSTKELTYFVSQQPRQLSWNTSTKKSEFVDLIARSIIGRRTSITTAFGSRELVYADYTASGRLLTFLEEYMRSTVYPLYANSHTESSRTGLQMTSFREEARKAIALDVHASLDEYAVVFTGTGSTGAMNKLLRVLGFALPEWANKRWNLESHVPQNERPVVFVGPFEHHSNELIWRESLAEVVVIDEDQDGMPDLAQLEVELQRFCNADQDRVLIGSFSAGSNVTGLLPDVRALSSLLHRYGALAFFDFAGSAAHVPIDVTGAGWRGSASDDPSIDALFLSPHKMIGGPGSSGVLVARRRLFDGLGNTDCHKPTVPGGGTVTYVDQHASYYTRSVEAREESGTPGILQDIRAGLAFSIKHQVGGEEIERREARHTAKALDAWRQQDNHVMLVGSNRGAYFDTARRTSIISFLVRAPEGCLDSQKCDTPGWGEAVAMSVAMSSGQPARRLLHCNFVSELLNDLYGIQSRSGCVCAGPYAHRLYGWTSKREEKVVSLRDKVDQGLEVYKPGWCRVNFNFFISDAERDFIIAAVLQVAERGWQLLPHYRVTKCGHWVHQRNRSPSRSHSMMHLDAISATAAPELSSPKSVRTKADFDRVLDEATKIYDRALLQGARNNGVKTIDFVEDVTTDEAKDVWWMMPSDAVRLMKSSRKTRLQSIE